MASSSSLVHLRGPSGAKATINTLGATVTSFVGQDGVEKLYVTKVAETGPMGDIVGGIPIVFPTFSEPPKEAPWTDVPFHGFANKQVWTHKQGDDDASATFTLEPTEAIRKFYKPEFKLEYKVSITSGDTLASTLTVTNPSSAKEDLKFHALFHTYYLLPEGVLPSDLTIKKSLKGLSYIDKTDQYKVKTDERDVFTYDGFTDSVYSKVPNKFVVEFGESKQGVDLQTDNLGNLTTWNPAKKPDDTPMGEEDWKTFVCIEPGHVTEWKVLQPGQSWTCKHDITSTRSQ